jgi:ubiquinone/menaquinone biosynthesis C-methylase UbiE
MTLDSEEFEVNRWHSPEYVKSWMDNETMEAGRRILQKKLVSLLPFEPEASIRVLDVGTGTGALSLAVLDTFPKAQLVCHDFSETMIAHARQQLEKCSKQVTFVKSDLRDPAWPHVIDGVFDAVVSSFVMHTIPDSVGETYREIFKLVNREGCFLAGDIFIPPGIMFRKTYRKARLIAYQNTIKSETGVEKTLQEVEQELHERRRSRNAAFPGRIWNRDINAPTLINHLEWLAQAGFDEVDCLWKDTSRAIIGGFKH